MARKRKAAIPDNIAEEYYQISQEILSSFPKYRPPVDLFQFRADIAQLYPYSRKGARLSNEQVEEIQQLCESGDLFVSRTDHPIYSEHIVKPERKRMRGYHYPCSAHEAQCLHGTAGKACFRHLVQ